MLPVLVNFGADRGAKRESSQARRRVMNGFTV
jgi:hypothetical protein